MRHTGSIMEDLLATAERLANLGSFQVRLPSGERTWSDGIFRIHGLHPEVHEPSLEALLSTVHADDRDLLEATIRRSIAAPAAVPPAGVRMEYRVVHPDASIRWMRFMGHAEWDREEAAGRWYGIVQDVTDQLLAERDLQAHSAVGLALREWEEVADGLVALLRRMATALDYPIAALWTWDRARQKIVCRTQWSVPDAGLKDFATVTSGLLLGVGEGIPGRAWETRMPQFAPEVVAEARFVHSDRALAAGLRSVLAFPATGRHGEPIAVLSFYSLDRREPSPRLTRTLVSIGDELGRFLERRRAQLEPGRLSARELQVLTLAAEGLSGPRIAERLVVSPSTVKTHFENIYDKLGVGDRAGAVAQALRVGLIS